MTIYVAPRFETGDERYAWLNRIQAIGKGIIHEDLSLDYEWYEGRWAEAREWCQTLLVGGVENVESIEGNRFVSPGLPGLYGGVRAGNR